MNIKYMKEALKMAQKGFNKDEVPVGCVIVKDEKIIARATNLKEEKKSSIFHAEINCLIKAAKVIGDWRLDGCDIYVTLEPCIMCVGAMINYRISNIYFGAYDFKGGALSSNIKILDTKGLNHYPNFQGGIMEKECSQILKDYFKNKREK
ncbi:MAG: nucleoside deaminase [Bacilli bacterium]|nr:nucleoside deaminase [Bacilli bacterium]